MTCAGGQDLKCSPPFPSLKCFYFIFPTKRLFPSKEEELCLGVDCAGSHTAHPETMPGALSHTWNTDPGLLQPVTGRKHLVHCGSFAQESASLHCSLVWIKGLKDIQDTVTVEVTLQMHMGKVI